MHKPLKLQEVPLMDIFYANEGFVILLQTSVMQVSLILSVAALGLQNGKKLLEYKVFQDKNEYKKNKIGIKKMGKTEK